MQENKSGCFILNTVYNFAVADPVCQVVQSAVRGRSVATLMCRMTYEWLGMYKHSNVIPFVKVSLSWTGVSGTTVKTTADPRSFNGTVETKAVIADISSDTIPSHTCKIEFNFSPGFHARYFNDIYYAVNPVSSTCVTRPTRVWRKSILTHISLGAYDIVIHDILDMLPSVDCI